MSKLLRSCCLLYLCLSIRPAESHFVGMHLGVNLAVICFFTIISSSMGALQVIRDLVEFNLAGHPVLHKDQYWPFDPDVGQRRARQYQELNGVLGEKAIERLGLGIDGYDRERLEKQQARDAGHLGGVDYLTP